MLNNKNAQMKEALLSGQGPNEYEDLVYQGRSGNQYSDYSSDE